MFFNFNTGPTDIKDKTKIGYDLKKISKETTLKGLFVQEMQKRIAQENLNQEEKEIIEKAIEIGFEALE